MSTPSLEEHAMKKSSGGNISNAKTSKIQRIQVCPSPQLDARKAMIGNQVHPALTEKKDDQRPCTPVSENILFEVDETKTLWSKVENGNGPHENSTSILPRKRRCCFNEAYVMRTLIVLALLFSIANLFLTVILTRRQNGNCACPKNSQTLGKKFK